MPAVRQNPDARGRILVAGGAGYVGSILVRRLLERGYAVRVLDRLFFGEEPLAEVRDRIDLVVADVRDVPVDALDDIDGVINVAGLSNDPTADYDPAANWQMNAIATETLAIACIDRGIERYVFASSCSLYDGLPGIHDERAPVEPCSAYATSKRYAEERLIELAGERFCPVILRNGTVYGWSPRMRFDLVVNTFVRDALLRGELTLHGGGRMWRPLVDVRDCADAMVHALEGPADRVRGEVFNVLHSNYRIRDLALTVAESVRQTGRSVSLGEGPGPAVARDYRCEDAKLPATLGYRPRRSVRDAVSDMLRRIDCDDRDYLADARHCNIEWMERIDELGPRPTPLSSGS